MEREQFTFFSSFAKAAKRIRKAADRCAFYDAVVDYALLGVCPDLDSLPDAVALAIELIKPTLDASRRKAENGLLGGKSKANAKQTESKTEANVKREQTSSEKEGEIEKEKEIENECYSTPTPPLGEVMAFFMNNINAMPSPDVCDLLRQYTETLSAPVVIHAMQITQNERKGWSYLKAILARYEREGLTAIEAVKAQEQAREAGKDAPKRKYVTASDYAAAPPKPVDMEKLRGVIDRI